MIENPALKWAIKLLSKRDYSRVKLMEKLVAREYETDDIAAAILYLEEKKFLREDLYIEARIKGLARKGYSGKLIEHRLKQEGLSKITNVQIKEVMEQEGFSEREQIRKLIKKRARGGSGKDKLKLYNYLCGKGFSYELVREMLMED